MDNPVLVDVLRGAVVESRHRGAVVVADAGAALVFALGDVERPVFPRSAVKALQALPLLESGAADRFGLSEAELALACSSHSGEDLHAATAAAMLAKAGREPVCLECGIQHPMGAAAARALAWHHQTPSALHNNCSGKHAGFICAATAMDVDVAGYVTVDHPVQREVRAALEAMTGAPHGDALRGTDGCSIPTYAVPLKSLALAFARLGTGVGLPPLRAAALARLRKAVAGHPFMLAGTGRFDTRITEIFRERVFLKTGAEGVYCGSLPELGLGFAVKCDDGATRAAEVVSAALIARFLPLTEPDTAALKPFVTPLLTNWNGIAVGALAPAAALAS
ncbi:asparaginase [Chelatococcus asaccharovorans]|uniref:Asparaginase n=1 Tax=Chelatococcus asaccharovorans TaxID=28210 RepID=A0A2V3U2P1_9HYPH|nr:asparaginase [Chelatococcus asaccharovorans]MBS7702481.1 asparaginase [Chelatococcus asaccharovorans]PXW56310.1 asparaginase [Chelatococcus asaccharovorans]